MKKTKIIVTICILIVVLCCFVGCNSNNAKSITINSTLTHADGVLLQKIESNFTKSDKGYDYTTKTTELNSLDSGKSEMYSTEETSGTNAKITVPSWDLKDFEAIYESTENRLYGKITAVKIASLGITDAASDVIVDVEFNEKLIVSMSVSYTNAKGSAVSIVATMTY